MNNVLNDEISAKHYFEFRQVSPDERYQAGMPFWLKQELPSKDALILDYGCGYGKNLWGLRKEGYINIHGVDIEETAIKVCHEDGLNVKWIDKVSQENPFEYKFDIIILSHVIEHIPKEIIISTLSKIRTSFLKSDGKIIVAVPNAQSNTGCYWAYEDFTHSVLFTSGSLYYVLRAAGFQNVEFLDIDGFAGEKGFKVFCKRILLKLYQKNYKLWNKVTASAWHQQSPLIFSFEIKAKASSNKV